MRTYVLATRRFWLGTALAAGAWPRIASPGLDARGMEGADLLYLCAHGLPDQPYLYDDAFQTVLAADDVARLDLTGAVVYLAGCYGAGAMAEAFLAAGARFVVGDRESTFAGHFLPLGSNRLGWHFVRALRRGLPPYAALDEAAARFARTMSEHGDESVLDSVVAVGAG